MTCDRIRGHWGGQGTYPLCACPTPPQSPQAKLTDRQFDRFEHLVDRFATHAITPCELDEYRTLWNLAYPHLGTWTKAA